MAIRYRDETTGQFVSWEHYERTLIGELDIKVRVEDIAYLYETRQQDRAAEVGGWEFINDDEPIEDAGEYWDFNLDEEEY